MQAHNQCIEMPKGYSEQLANEFADILFLPQECKRKFFFDVKHEVFNFNMFTTWTLPEDRRNAELEAAYLELTDVQINARSLLASMERMNRDAQFAMAASLIVKLGGPEGRDFSKAALTRVIEHFAGWVRGIDNLASNGMHVCADMKREEPVKQDHFRVLPKRKRGRDLWAFEHFAYQVARWARCYGGNVTVDKNSGSGTLVALLRKLAIYLPLHACPGFVADDTNLSGLGRLDDIRRLAVEGIPWPVWKKAGTGK